MRSVEALTSKIRATSEMLKKPDLPDTLLLELLFGCFILELMVSVAPRRSRTPDFA
jgi:hypothetical protein